MNLSSTDINTKGFENLLNLVNTTVNDSFELYYGLFLYNANATGGALGSLLIMLSAFRAPCDSWVERHSI